MDRLLEHGYGIIVVNQCIELQKKCKGADMLGLYNELEKIKNHASNFIIWEKLD